MHTALASGEASLPRSPDIRILSSSARSLTLEYTPRYTDTDTIQAGQRTFVRFGFDGSVDAMDHDRAGAPDVRYRQLSLALPSSGAHQVRLITIDYETLHGVDLAPVPRFHMKDGMMELTGYDADPSHYGRSGFVPAAPVELMQGWPVRSLLIGGIRLWPMQYDPAARTMRRVSRMVVEVEFAPGTAVQVEEADVRLLGPSVVNEDLLTQLPRRARSTAKTALTSSVLASGEWYRIPVTEEGIYRIDATYLAAAGISVSGLDPRTIRLYGNGGEELPESVTAPRPVDLVENAIYVEGESDGQFGASDFILFYGRSTRGMRYDSAARTFRHYINHYTETNYYWLTFGGAQGKRMAELPSSTAPPSLVVEKFTDGVFVEEEKSNQLGSGKDWYGQSMDGPSGAFTHVNVLPGLVPNEQITYRYTLVASDETLPRFTITDGSATLGTHTLPAAQFVNYTMATAGTFEVSGSSNLNANTSQFHVAFTSSSTSSEAWIDWVEILYPRMLWGVNNILRFTTPDATGIAEYRLQQFASRPMIFRVNDPADVRLVSGVTGSYVFRDSVREGRVSTYWATATGAWKTPAAPQKMTNQDLRGYADGADFIILTSQEFRSAADRLKAYREQPENGGLKTIV
ncbi:MAG: hypothetical protein IT282_05580, partial [Bacteroidetes bacterium]|nr:hypothetical protein [Bacteroidota bacterium]